MKKLLIIGSSGMAGHAITKYLTSLEKYDIRTMSRDENSYYCNLDIEDTLKELTHIVKRHNFDVVINCIGLLVKPCQEHPDSAIYINSYFPHYLETITKNTNIKVITLSTDCTFNGKKGNYLDTEILDGEGYYAKSKVLGELNNKKDLTIRMSIIGKELKSNGSGLFEWFMRQKEPIKGYFEHWWTGITTLELSKAIDNIISNTNLTGIYQLAMRDKISKYDLLKQLNLIFRNNEIDIIKDDVYHCDKSLINSKEFISGYELPKTYYKMLTEYKEWLNE